MKKTMIQEIWQHHRESLMMSKILRREGIENSGSEEPLQSIPLPCLLRRAREKCLDDRNCLKSMTHHAAGIGTCTQSMTIPSHLSSEMHLQKFPDQTEFQSWIVNFRAEVCAKAKNLALTFAMNPKSITGNISLIMKNWI